MKALIYVNGQLVHTVVGMRHETSNELRKRISIVTAIEDNTLPNCPKCQRPDGVKGVCWVFQCSNCGTTFYSA